MGTTPRGRPPHPPEVPDLPDGIQGRRGIGWLLRVNRLYGPDERLATGGTFAKAFRGGSWPTEVNPWSITRWEKGQTAATHSVIRRYEELLDLPRNLLVGLVDQNHRGAVDAAGPPPLRRPPDPNGKARLGELVERAAGSDVMGGADWDELTADLDALRTVLHPGDSRWSQLIERLTTEMMIAEKLEWSQRNEAVVRFIGDPVNTPAVIAACASLAADPRNQMPAEPLCMLEIAPHPDAARHLIREISDPTTESARRGAWWAASQRTAHDYTPPWEKRLFAVHAGNMLTGYDGHPDCLPAAAEVLRHVGGNSPALLKRLRRTDGFELVRNVLVSGRLEAPDLARPYVRRIATETLGRLPRERLERDSVLEHLLNDVLFDAQIDTQIIALMRLWSTPYRVPVADVLAAELDRPPIRGNATLSSAILRALAFLGTDVHRRLLERFALRGGLPPEALDTVIWHLAHCSGTSTDRFWEEMINRHLKDRTSPLAEHTARGLVYALGIHRRFAELRRLAGDVTMPAPIRAAVRWWLNTPTHILRSTDREDLAPSGGY